MLGRTRHISQNTAEPPAICRLRPQCLGAPTRVSTAMSCVDSREIVLEFTRMSVCTEGYEGVTEPCNAHNLRLRAHPTPSTYRWFQGGKARRRGLSARHFSFNVAGGRCERCQGAGILTVNMQLLPDVEVPCPVCHGHRFTR